MSNYCHFTPVRPKSRVIAHRGMSACAPENTLASFSLAARYTDWIEFDLQLTKDNVLVIFHDETLERTTNGSGRLWDKTCHQLGNLDAGRWFSPAFSQERIPIFVEILPKLWQLSLSLNIELKLPKFFTSTQVDRLTHHFIQALSQHWPYTRPWPLISSFNWLLLEKIRLAIPQAPIGYLTESCNMALIHKLAMRPNTALHCHFAAMTPYLLAQAKAVNLPVLLYTVNDAHLATSFLQAGAFAVFSDDCRLLTPKVVSTLP